MFIGIMVGEYHTWSISIRPLVPTTLARFGHVPALDDRVAGARVQLTGANYIAFLS
jgi:hypothetical protein